MFWVFYLQCGCCVCPRKPRARRRLHSTSG